MVTDVEEVTLNDAEKVAFEKDALSITTSFSGDSTLALPATGASYADVAITWTVNGTATTGSYAIVRTAEAQTLTVIATLALGTVTETKEFTVTVAALPAAGEDEPAVFHLMAVDSKGATLYWTGAVNGGKLVGTTDVSAAADVYVEDAGDGKSYIYVLDNGSKKYLKMTGNSTKNFAFDTTASYKWNVTETSIQSAESSISSRYIYSYNSQDFRTYDNTNYTPSNSSQWVGLAKLVEVE
jgi:hypothetical protein